MKHRPCSFIRHLNRTAAVAIALLGLSSASSAATINLNEWYQFGIIAEAVSPCDAADPSPCEGAEQSIPGPDAVIDFVLTSPGILRIVDGAAPGETYDASFSGLPTIETVVARAPTGTEGLCFSAPDCVADTRFYYRGDLLPAGTYSVTLALDDPNAGPTGFGFVRVDEVPEPATFAMLGAGLVGLALVSRKRKA